MLNDISIKAVKHVWKDFDVKGVAFYNVNEETTPDIIDKQRLVTIPKIKKWITEYINGQVDLDEFKTSVDSLNKRYPYWGFKAIKGQMFFNMLVKSAVKHDKKEQFDNLLRASIPLPNDIDQAVNRIKEFKLFSEKLADTYEDKRSAPKIGSIPFFLSYFWQIQEPMRYPVYYSSMINALGDLNIWVPDDEIEINYLDFYYLNYEIVDICKEISEKEITLWDIEHAFWYYNQKSRMEGQEVVEDITKDGVIESSKRISDLKKLPDSYIPPIISILPKIAENDPHLDVLCNESGISIVKVFEDRLAILFEMLGYEVTNLGQGHGRVPDGIVISREFNYAILYDAKVRKDSYTMGTDERAIREYITNNEKSLKKQGYKNIYFMIISSKFSGDHDSEIRNLKIDTNISEILLVETAALLELLEAKFRNPEISLGQEGIQNLLASSGLLTVADIRTFTE